MNDNFFTSTEDYRKRIYDLPDANPCCMHKHQKERFLVAVMFENNKLIAKVVIGVIIALIKEIVNKL